MKTDRVTIVIYGLEKPLTFYLLPNIKEHLESGGLISMIFNSDGDYMVVDKFKNMSSMK